MYVGGSRGILVIDGDKNWGEGKSIVQENSMQAVTMRTWKFCRKNKAKS